MNFMNTFETGAFGQLNVKELFALYKYLAKEQPGHPKFVEFCDYVAKAIINMDINVVREMWDSDSDQEKK